MDQYLCLLIPFLVGWTSIYQLFWCELQGYKVLTHCHIYIYIIIPMERLDAEIFCNRPLNAAYAACCFSDAFLWENLRNETWWFLNGPWDVNMAIHGYGSIPIDTIFNGMNIHLPAMLGFTRYQGFDTSPHGPMFLDVLGDFNIKQKLSHFPPRPMFCSHFQWHFRWHVSGWTWCTGSCPAKSPGLGRGAVEASEKSHEFLNSVPICSNHHLSTLIIFIFQ